ncbi:MAG: hypothetical protein EXR58_00200 [Chloroflexi bacterium]|nr:hypothetical protein [Chloroflexota bacterium]
MSAYYRNPGQRLPAYERGVPIGSVIHFGPFKIGAAHSPAQTLPSPVGIFSGELGLTGVDVQGARVTLTWQAIKVPSVDYTVFVHELDGEGRVVAQNDSPPNEGGYPTHFWEDGEVVEDPHLLTGDPAAATQIEIGLYAYPSLTRQPVVDPRGRPIGDHVLLPICGTAC